MKSYVSYQDGTTSKIYMIAEPEEITEDVLKKFIHSKTLLSYDTAYNYNNQISTRTGKPYTKKPRSYNNISMGFDIETTNILEYENSKCVYAKAYMYHWQFSLNNLIICGRTWDSFQAVFDKIIKAIKYSIKYCRTVNKDSKSVVWVANLGFEFQYLRHRIKYKDLFAREKREPINFTIEDAPIEFRDCLQLSGGSLDSLAKDYTTTKKLVGDLDYSVLRNSHTELDEQTELPYCYNDVAILSEWGDYAFSEYVSKGYFPLTKTGLLRHEVKKRMSLSDFKYIWSNCPDEEEYSLFMQYVYKGGYAHSCLYNVCHLLNDIVYSVDFTSSYPAVMLHELYPLSKFLEYSSEYIEEINKRGKDGIKDYITEATRKHNFIIASVRLENVAPIGYNTYISYSKLQNKEELKGELRLRIDNGRILSAPYLEISETELDLITIYEMYTFDSIQILRLWECHEAGRLPDYLLEPLLYFYRVKAELKAKGMSNTKAYATAKALVNSAYGMACTKQVEQIIKCDPDSGWIAESDNKTYDDRVRSQFLLPTWGIYICAYARRNLMRFVIEFDADVVCCDTDSIYFINWNEHKESIEKWNAEMKTINNKLFNNDPLMEDLGCFDIQNVNDKKEVVPYEKFATMGAKRYLLYGWNDGKYGYKQTVAGLPKGSLIKAIEEHNQRTGEALDPFEVFMQIGGYQVDSEVSRKTTTAYNDEPHSDVVAGEEMTELSSVAIVPIKFSMTLAREFKELLIRINNIYTTKFERRIL